MKGVLWAVFVSVALGSDVIITEETQGTVATRLTYGVNTPSYVGSGFMETNAPTLLHAIGGTNIRWPGGNWANKVLWNNDFQGCQKYFQQWAHSNAAWTFTYESAAKVAKAADVDVLYQMNAAVGLMCGPDAAAQSAVGFVKNMTALGYPVKYIEVGNENYGHWEVPYPDHPEVVNGTGYGHVCVAVSKAIKAIDSTIQVGCVGVLGDSPATVAHWLGDVLTVAGPTMDFLIIHAYFDKTRNPTPHDLLNYGCVSDPSKLDCGPAGIVKNVAAAAKQFSPTRPNPIPIAVTEYNIELPAATATVTIMSGLFAAKYLGQSLQAGLWGSCYFALVNGGSKPTGDFAMFAKGTEVTPVRGSAYAFGMFHMVTGGVGATPLRSTTGVDNATVMGFKRSGSGYGVIIINEGPTAIPALKLTGPWQAKEVSIYTLEPSGSGSDPYGATSFLWNGVGPKSGGKGGPYPFTTVPPKNAAWTGSVAVGAASVMGLAFAS